MFKKNVLALTIGSICAMGGVSATQIKHLPEIQVMATEENIGQSQLLQSEIQRKQPRDLKALFEGQLDVQVNDLQNSRSGNAGINVRGLQGNRVAMSIDGIPLPEGQENKLFVSLGQDFGAGNSVEPMALRSATVEHSGSHRALSGSVSFATLEPNDLIKSGQVGGFVASGYHSVDNAFYGVVAGAAKNERYQGLILTSARFGHQTENNGDVGGVGATRTQSNPAEYKNSYVLVKNAYQFNDKHKLKLTFEHQQKDKETSLDSTVGEYIDRTTGIQTSGNTYDKTRRERISLEHEYRSDKNWLSSANTQLYYQNALNENYRVRHSHHKFRAEVGEVKDKMLGIGSNFTSIIEAELPQVLGYGASYQYHRVKNDLSCNSCSTSADPAASTTQMKTHLYIEDKLILDDFVVTPHLGVMFFRSHPSRSGYTQAAEQVAEVKGQKKTIFLPKLTFEWKIASEFQPFFQYSRGVKTASAQQLTSSFGNTVASGGRIIRQYAVVGNPNLKPEVADNFSLGLKGNNEWLNYTVSAYYNKYKNFIDWVSSSAGNYNPLIQYHNLADAKIYGVTASAKIRFYDDFFLTSGVAYAKGNAKQGAKKLPINTIQPLKLKAGVGYEGERFGADIQLTHLRAKKAKEINGNIYNPMSTVNIVDLGMYWKPLSQLTLSANVNNLFDRKYWNWSDISYFAIQSSSESPDRTASLTKANADTYTAPGRHFNLGLRYEF